MNIIYVLIACIGLTIIITQSTLFSPFREFIERRSSFFGDLIECPMCTGFWVGLFMSFLYGYDSIFLCFGTSLFSWLVSIIGNLLISLSYYLENLDE